MNARLLLEAPGRDSEIGRFAEIARVAAAKGFGKYLERFGLGRHADREGRLQGKSDAVRLREALEELGPTFVKFGQMLSQRDDLLLPAFASELRSLQDRAASFPAAAVREIIEQETGLKVEQLFATFDELPMAAASVAQVHCATLTDGTAVIVKVQRPGIAQTVEGDIAVLRRIARLLSAVPSLRSFNLPGLVDEFSATLRGELDFEQEGRNAARFAELNSEEPSVFVPKVYWVATTRRMLTMEHSSGHRLDDVAGPQAAKPELARSLMRLFLTQVFEHGVFHADPHPGNVFLLPDGRICFHDFGALGELSPGVQESLRQLFLGVIARDAGWVASAYLGMGGAAGELDRGAFTRDLGGALDRYYRASDLGQQSFGAILREFVALGRRHDVRLLRETTMLMRAFAELESLVKELDPGFSSLESFKAYSPRLLKRAFMPDMGVARLAQTYRLMTSVRDIAGETPMALHRLMGRFERGEPLFDIRHQSGASIERHLLHAANRLAFALIIASIVVGSAVIIAAHAGPHIGDVPVLGIAGFVIASVLGAGWALLALRSGKL